MTSIPKKPLQAKFKKNGVYYYYQVDSKKVEVGEHSDNPHGSNSTIICLIEDFINDTGEGSRCRSVLKSHFGEQELDKVLKALS